MVNILIPLSKDDEKFYKLIKKLTSTSDVKVFVGIKRDLEEKYLPLESENIKIISFVNESKKEEILNSLNSYVKDGSVLIMRKPITIEEINLFISQKEDIVVCEKERSKFKKYIFIIWQYILRFFLGINLYKGHTSVIYFSENISPVLREMKNISYASRVDRWKGISKGSVKVSCEQEKYEKEKGNFWSNLIYVIDALFIGTIVTTLCVIFTKVSILGGLLLFCLDALCLAIIILLIIVMIFENTIGQKNVGFAVEDMNIGN